MARSKRKKAARRAVGPPRDAFGRFVAKVAKTVRKTVRRVLAPVAAAKPARRKAAAPAKRKGSSSAPAKTKRKGSNSAPAKTKRKAVTPLRRPKKGAPARRPAQARKKLEKLPAPRKKATRKETRKLERREWSELSATQQGKLRSWRGVKAGETRRERRYGEMVEKLTGGTRLERQTVQNQLRRSGTRGLAAYLRDVLGFDDVDIAEVFAYWFYSE